MALWPTSIDDLLGTGKFGLGPTALLLKQDKAWTIGFLTNHLWSFGGQESTGDVNATCVEPWISYTNEDSTTWSLSAQCTFDWQVDQLTASVLATASKLVTIGEQPVQFSLSPKYYIDKPSGGSDWGLDFAVTFLFGR